MKHNIKKLLILSFACFILVNCDKLKDKDIKPSEVKAIAHKTAEDTVNKTITQAVNQSIDDIRQMFSELSSEQLKKTKEIAKQETQQAIENMELQFSELSSEQLEKTKEITKQKTQQAIENMELQFSNLSENQINVIKLATLEIARQIALESSKTAVEKSTQQAIDEIELEFSILAEESLKRAEETVNQKAQDTAQIAIQKAISEIKKELYTLVKEEQKNIEQIAFEVASQIAKSTAQEISESHTEKALDDMRDEFSNLSSLQIEIIKTATLEIASQLAKDTASNLASTVTEEAINNMEDQFADLSQKKIQEIKDTSLKVTEKIAFEIASNIANKTAEEIATQISNQVATDIQEELFSILDTEIKNIKSENIETSTTTAREVADATLEELVKQYAFPIIDRAIKEIEEQHSNLLKAGLQSIITAAISAVTASTESKNTDSDSVKQAIDSATEVAKEIAFKEEENDQDHLTNALFNLSFEQCTWKNRLYTSQIVKEHTFFPLSDPLQKLMKSWDSFKEEENQTINSSNSEENTLQKEFAYLSPLYDDFVLSFFQESIKDTQLSENDVPLECFFAGSVKGANLYTSGSDFYYCSKDSVEPENMNVIDDDDNTRIISAQRACLNRDYTFLTAKAFNKTADCFGFDKTEKELIFKLFNHESSFLHNVKSSTKARCYGQLTKIAIKEINKQIYFSTSKNPLPYSYIFGDVIEECPGLQDAVLNPAIYSSQSTRKSINKFNSIVSKLPIDCKITQNPYSCLFYAFYNFKINSEDIDLELSSPTTSFGIEKRISSNFKDKFLLPISLNEMRGVTTISTGRDMIFWDDSELWAVLKDRSSRNLNNIRRLPLFENEKEVKNLFKIWSYNGGISISNHMVNFIRQLKRSIAQSCSDNAKSRICQYRFAIQKGQGISTADIKKDFQAYILENYELQESQKRRKEVKTFTEDVEKSLDYLYNKNGAFRYHLKNLVPDLEKQDIENFQDYLKDICPATDPSLFN